MNFLTRFPFPFNICIITRLLEKYNYFLKKINRRFEIWNNG
nr:MAG TPA: hypothetical protein [Caudoviricetes sp.]